MSKVIVELSELCDVITKGTTPSNIGAEFTEKGIKYIRSEMLTSAKYISDEGLLYISEETHKKLKRSQLKPGDIIFSMAGVYLGKTAILRECDTPANTNQAVALIRIIDEKCNREYVYYYLNLPEVVKSVNSITGQSAQPNINLKQIGNIQIMLPERSVQDAVVTILSTYDSLIANNQKQIKLLEEAAQRLYKEWFVDLRFPGHETTPIVDGVPEGWEKVEVGTCIAKIARTKQVMTAELLDVGRIPVVDQSRSFVAGYTNDEETIVDLGTPIIVFGDHTRVLKYIQFPFAKGADGTQLIVTNNEKMPQSLLYCSLVNVDLSNYHYARHFKYLKAEEILLPSLDVAHQFDGVVSPLFEQVQMLRDKCKLAAEARDRLLPKLMSGEIEV